ncbi:MAG: hypothetical protein IPH65_12850 [Dehalococcoidia bacterium]|uniref:hypothetical protein n=1 Tax=Candidatus Amarobacter glycogenicus TaxID=3140699 RepID=UPI00313713E3|nr:hypothetical protein [Dehalococcoidia bacterium]
MQPRFAQVLGDSWHYVALSGYGSYGDTTDYVDPYETAGCSPASLGPHYGFSSATMQSMVAEHGIIW